jgi:hypothetical protein
MNLAGGLTWYCAIVGGHGGRVLTVPEMEQASDFVSSKKTLSLDASVVDGKEVVQLMANFKGKSASSANDGNAVVSAALASTAPSGSGRTSLGVGGTQQDLLDQELLSGNAAGSSGDRAGSCGNPPPRGGGVAAANGALPSNGGCGDVGGGGSAAGGGANGAPHGARATAPRGAAPRTEATAEATAAAEARPAEIAVEAATRAALLDAREAGARPTVRVWWGGAGWGSIASSSRSTLVASSPFGGLPPEAAPLIPRPEACVL